MTRPAQNPVLSLRAKRVSCLNATLSPTHHPVGVRRESPDRNQIPTMQISSTAFENGTEIPEKFTFDGENARPPLRISGVPDQARSLVLFMEDLDSPIGPFTHWVVWNLPPQTEHLGEDPLPREAETGINGFGEVRYSGPCPPSGKHRYRFRLLALDTRLEATSPDRKDQIESAMDGNVLSEATLTGLYTARP